MWYYKDQPFESLAQLKNYEHIVGFCYKITNLITGQLYIGKKNVRTDRKKKLRLEERSKDRRKKTYTIVSQESNWRSYFGSCQPLLEDIRTHGREHFRRDILAFACTKKQLSYLELKYQVLYDVLSTPGYNSNILGRYFSGDLNAQCTA